MKSLTYVEIDIDFCELEYGVAPCTAQLGYTGDKKCYNSRATCQDVPNYDPAPKTLRFAVATDYLPADPPAIPCIQAVTRNPTRLRIAEDLGQRASVTVTFSDFASEDYAFGLDPYRDSRASIQGTFWGKFRARHPFLFGRPLRLIYGELGQDIADMETRHYFIESASGPSKDSFTITAKDPLKLADDDKAQVPRLSRGTLAVAIDDTETSATLADFEDQYPASGILSIGKELMSFTRSGTTLTLTRGQYNTIAESHDADALVQVAEVYTSQRASAIVGDLLDQAGVPSAFYDVADWTTVDEEIIRRQYSAIIAKPTAVKALISELSEQAGFTVYWDEIQQTIRFDPLGISSGSTLITPDLMLDGSYSSREDTSRRVSQIWVYYGLLNPLENIDEPKNYLSAITTIDIEAESAAQYGQPAIRQIFSRWITDRVAAEEISDRVLKRYRDPPRRIGFGLMVDAARKQGIDTNAPLNVAHFSLQDDEGLPVTIPVLVTAYDRRDDTATVETEEIRIDIRSPLDPFVLAPNTNVQDPSQQGATAFNLRDRFDQEFGIEPTEYTEVTCIIRSDTVIGSPHTSTPAFDVGDWPTGVTITIINDGRIAGAGGAGGLPNPGSIYGDGAGKPGGVGLYTRFPVTVVNNGVIAGGGGGGGALFIIGIPPTDIGRSGGGGAGRAAGTPNGTLTAGGAGGSFGIVLAGDGGDPGQAGDTGEVQTSLGPQTPTPGGAGGAAIDGDTLVTLSGAGTVLGSQIN